VPSPEAKPGVGGTVAAQISNGMVRLVAEHTGRGPTKARTTIGRDHVLVMLRDTLTKGERVLAENGHGYDVLETRRRYQAIMRSRAVAMVEELVERKVIGFMSDNHLEPDLGVEVFILEASGESHELSEGDSHDEQVLDP